MVSRGALPSLPCLILGLGKSQKPCCERFPSQHVSACSVSRLSKTQTRCQWTGWLLVLRYLYLLSCSIFVANDQRIVLPLTRSNLGNCCRHLGRGEHYFCAPSTRSSNPTNNKLHSRPPHLARQSFLPHLVGRPVGLHDSRIYARLSVQSVL